ncbi:MAG: 2-amino-4-hydroxy-6-hydroxymethyldihydropteridine diphosphokinase [Fluviicola sp.]|jgi:deoxyguanosine kinase|nr:2-amino-4-hydroxy-6-hydroxymethyldihydropteridine diphosphokinase [Fluviicola sp.]
MEELNKDSTVFLSIGSNLGNRFLNIQNAIEQIEETIGKVTICSSIYENPPLDFEAEELFYNCCLELQTSLTIEEVLFKTQQIENKIGRKNKTALAYESRLIDIDILYFEKIIYTSDKIIIPHLKLSERKFVLVPMKEIAADFIDPKLNLSITELVEKCIDNSVLVKTTKSLKLKITQ